MDKFVTRDVPNTAASKRPRDEEEWQHPKRFATSKESKSTGNGTPTSNRYGTLPVEVNDDTQGFYKNATKKKITNGVPPIILELQDTVTNQTLKDIIDKHSKTYHLQYIGQNKVKILCHSITAHQEVKKGLQDENLSYHTFTRKDEKLPKAVVKGIPKSLQEIIPSELEQVGFPGAKVTELKTNKPTQCPALLVQLQSGTDMSKFRQIKYLGNCVVEIQKYKPIKKFGTQCYRCQSFGHASRNCNRPARCVKCSQKHLSSECPVKGVSDSVSCCNCQQHHPANYSQCPARLKYVERISSKKVIIRNTLPSNTTQTTIRPPIMSKSFAAVTKAKKGPADGMSTENDHVPPICSHPRPPNQHTANSNAFCSPHDDATTEMLQILTTIKTIKEDFIKCDNFLDKVALILNHLGRYV